MPLFNLAAIFLYAIVFLLCATAALNASTSARSQRQVRGWAVCAAFFALLAAVRLLGVEELVRQALRQASRSMGEYDDRAVLQAPLVLLTLAGTLGLGLFAFRVWRKRNADCGERAVLVALFCVVGFVPLYVLRTISWHVTDRVLYDSSLHLNWFIDCGLSLLVGCAALLSMRRRRRARRTG